MGKFEEIANDLTAARDLPSDHIKIYLYGIIQRTSDTEVVPSFIEGALKRIKNADSYPSCECSHQSLFLGFLRKSGKCGLGAFRDKNHNKTVKCLLNNLHSPALKREMRRRISYVEQLEKNHRKFITTLSKEENN